MQVVAHDKVTSFSGPHSLGVSKSEPTAADECKFGLHFILNMPIRHTRQSALTRTAVVASPSAQIPQGAKQTLKLSKEEKKRRRTCRHEGCNNYIVHKGLCCRHGGGKKCSLEGCNSSAKHRGLCWKHGGSVPCKLDGCDKKAKARGLCWAHGGGTKCRNAECSKVAVSNGFCWAHGGGKRCEVNGCIKPAYGRTLNLCEKHFQQMRHATYFEVYVSIIVTCQRLFMLVMTILLS
ncbi:hypothetical protein F441_07258 [Phytophthora nicotianae CJ01A1]|uniref:WRKY19-like zinc finger domain-containing protein n=3 Tax=Phytophthora nicotianae TaxID=4792 RepID=V9FDB2_PHYNI|nr:hypothetical protein F443_07242 [Phytophthora nicotianae P1569]ETP18533.1 hypothetical protein F441_07258 [Phytophthora nicotianae CJ01A1]ETP46447.1 hypothetical protein F442_07312 [Phytophthora nicotianae P10297]